MQIGRALHWYHEAHGSLPPPYVADAKGRPMHSWRVLILPFMESRTAKSLYAAYHFDEPWNGPHNAALADQGASLFHCPQDVPQEGAPPMTSYVAVIGPDTCWPLDRRVRFRDVADGLSNTFLVVERGNSGIPWMEPRDIEPFQLISLDGKPGPTLTSAHRDGGHALMGDGATRFIFNNVPPETIRALLTRAGGEVIGDF